MTRIRIYPYRQGSRSAKALADATGGKVLKLENSKYRFRTGDTVINWGASECPFPCLNRPEATRIAGNKLTAFRVLQQRGVPIPRFAERTDGVTWEGATVVRHLLRGHSGEGIEMVEHGQELPRAPLYVEYIKKQQEYRLHVFKGTIIASQRKARDRDNPNPNWQVRNHKNGFIFVREGVNPPECVRTAAVGAVEALGLDFGAADVVFNERANAAFVLEVNCAPGLEGQTIDDYARRIEGLV